MYSIVPEIESLIAGDSDTFIGKHLKEHLWAEFLLFVCGMEEDVFPKSNLNSVRIDSLLVRILNHGSKEPLDVLVREDSCHGGKLQSLAGHRAHPCVTLFLSVARRYTLKAQVTRWQAGFLVPEYYSHSLALAKCLPGQPSVRRRCIQALNFQTEGAGAFRLLNPAH